MVVLHRALHLFIVFAVALDQSVCGQRVNNQKHARAKPGTGLAGLRSVELSSARDGPAEMTFTGEWNQSPFPVCPLGTYASEDNLGPAGCRPCPRGRYASSDNLGSEEECHLCPPGRYSNLPGAQLEAGCALCPPNTYGSLPGLSTQACTGRCPPGKYAPSAGTMFAQDCRTCPVGYTGGGGQCGVPAKVRRQLAAQNLDEAARSRSPEYDRLLHELEEEEEEY